MSIVFLVIIITYGGANAYIALRLHQWLSLLFPQINSAVYYCIFALVALSTFLGFLPIQSDAKKVINWIGAHWMGIYVYLLIFCLVTDCVVVLCSLTGLIPRPLPQSTIFLRGLTALLLTAGVIGYGIYNANQIKFVDYNVAIEGKTLSGDVRLVLISDLHLGAVHSERNLEKVIRGVNSLEPDVVCIAGDIFNGDINALSKPSRDMELLLEIKAKYGVYASLGNHDGGRSYDEMARFLSHCNIKLLTDEYEIIDKRLILLGRVDPSPIGGFGGTRRADIADVLSAMETDLPVVVMDHNPARIEEYASEVDLILSGHTHRGQLFPGSLITHAMFSVDYGYRQKEADGPHVIVTSGAGTWGPPVRVGSNNEIVCIRLR